MPEFEREGDVSVTRFTDPSCTVCGAVGLGNQRHKHERPGWKPRYDDFEGALEGYETEDEMNDKPKIQVPPRTAREINHAAHELERAAALLRSASDIIRPYSARMQFKAADLVEQATRLREQVLELGGDLEVVDG